MTCSHRGKTAVLNIRVPNEVHDLLKSMSLRLDLPISAIVNTSLLWARASYTKRSWVDDLERLHKMLPKIDSAGYFADEVASDELKRYDELCRDLVAADLIEGYRVLVKPNGDAGYLSFRLSAAGRVLAEMMGSSQRDNA